VFPISVDLNNGDWYTLDMHPNKQGHREIAAQILDELKRTEAGRQCLAGEP
jgi:lysophospholipase L1-like esterase